MSMYEWAEREAKIRIEKENPYRWFMVSVYNNQKAAIPKRDDKEASHG